MMCVALWRICGNHLRGCGRPLLVAGIVFVSLYLISGSITLTPRVEYDVQRQMDHRPEESETMGKLRPHFDERRTRTRFSRWTVTQYHPAPDGEPDYDIMDEVSMTEREIIGILEESNRRKNGLEKTDPPEQIWTLPPIPPDPNREIRGMLGDFKAAVREKLENLTFTVLSPVSTTPPPSVQDAGRGRVREAKFKDDYDSEQEEKDTGGIPLSPTKLHSSRSTVRDSDKSMQTEHRVRHNGHGGSTYTQKSLPNRSAGKSYQHSTVDGGGKLNVGIIIPPGHPKNRSLGPPRIGPPSRRRHDRLGRVVTIRYEIRRTPTPTPPPKPLFEKWREFTHPQCEGNFVGYSYDFAQLKDVLVVNRQALGGEGGKDMSKVMGQAEEKEFYDIAPGFFVMQCTKKPLYFFEGTANYLNSWLRAIYATSEGLPMSRKTHINERFTIALTRFEYVNMYHTMTDWYNAFLVMTFMNKTADETDIIFIDAHPKGSLDPVWSVLFHSFRWLSHLPKKVLYQNLVWGMQGYNSPLSQFEAKSLPYVEEFREFFLSRYQVPTDRPLNCSKLNMLFVWRRDYVAHPRNPKGTISRKIINERTLVHTLRSRYPYHTIRDVQLDALDMKQQLEYIASTDILIGMHGAGLTLALFLPKHSGLVEFFPNYWPNTNRHFALIAEWRNLHYEQWANEDQKNEYENFYTHIPPLTMETMVSKIVNKMCKKHKTSVQTSDKQNNADIPSPSNAQTISETEVSGARTYHDLDALGARTERIKKY